MGQILLVVQFICPRLSCFLFVLTIERTRYFDMTYPRIASYFMFALFQTVSHIFSQDNTFAPFPGIEGEQSMIK